MLIWPTLLPCRPRCDSDLKATRRFVTVLNNTEHKYEEKKFLKRNQITFLFRVPTSSFRNNPVLTPIYN